MKNSPISDISNRSWTQVNSDDSDSLLLEFETTCLSQFDDLYQLHCTITNRSSDSIFFLSRTCDGMQYNLILDSLDLAFRPMLLCIMSSPEIITIPGGCSWSFSGYVMRLSENSEIQLGLNLCFLKPKQRVSMHLGRKDCIAETTVWARGKFPE
jgi:hypothetical protein